MKPALILGLGNALMGDDGAGARVAELLAADGAVTERAEVIAGGTDVLRWMDQLDGRERVVLVDAVACCDEPGRISVVDEPLLDRLPGYAHSLSAGQAVELMRSLMPGLQKTKFTWVLVHVTSVRLGPELSSEVAASVPLAAAVVKGLL